MGQSRVAKVLAGKKPFSRQMIRKLADYFKVDVSVLAGEEHDRLEILRAKGTACRLGANARTKAVVLRKGHKIKGFKKKGIVLKSEMDVERLFLFLKKVLKIFPKWTTIDRLQLQWNYKLLWDLALPCGQVTASKKGQVKWVFSPRVLIFCFHYCISAVIGGGAPKAKRIQR